MPTLTVSMAFLQRMANAEDTPEREYAIDPRTQMHPWR
jgi:hypothetical protein